MDAVFHEWLRELERAIDANPQVPASRFLQLATIRPDGRPANRTLVFRAFGPRPGTLLLTTDARSEKVQELWAEPWCEACWYFPQSREQFRFLARAEILLSDGEHDAFRQQVWSELSDATRAQFFWPEPGAVRDEGIPLVTTSAAPQPPDAFALVLLDPHEIDHLRLDGDPQRRRKYRRSAEGSWTADEINP